MGGYSRISSNKKLGGVRVGLEGFNEISSDIKRLQKMLEDIAWKYFREAGGDKNYEGGQQLESAEIVQQRKENNDCNEILDSYRMHNHNVGCV